MKKSHKLPSFKKNIKDFLLSEEGKMTQKNIVKIGMSIAILGMLSNSTASAHSNYFFTDAQGGGHTSHNSHASHGSHCNCSVAS